MVADATKATSDDRARTYRSRLKDEPLPSVIVDCATAEILAANAGGLNALGLTPANRLPAALDSAMPAIAVLRELTAQGLTNASHKTLMFWKNGRVTAWPCSVSAADVTMPTHVVIVFRPSPDDNGDAPSLTKTNGASLTLDTLAANDDAPPRVVRDDQDTLKEIARRIREGQRVSAPNRDAAGATFVENVNTAAADGSPEPPLPPQDIAPPPVPVPPERPQKIASALPPTQIAKLAHELKTPLTAIAAAAEIMRDERLGAMGNEKYLGYAADIHASATHALAVIGDMLAAGDGDDNSVSQITAFDLTELAASTVSSLQPLAAQRSLTLSLDAETGLTPIRAQPTAIRQILINLLTNALKFTPPGGDVRVATGYLNDGAVYLVVRDTGEGMDERALAQAFNDAPVQMQLRAGGGRGIGLKLARRLAAENGAEFEIDSAPGMGTVVLLAFAKDLAGPLRPSKISDGG
jgi:two-component system cell cycle sensor histidine kinase PleC